MIKDLFQKRKIFFPTYRQSQIFKDKNCIMRRKFYDKNKKEVYYIYFEQIDLLDRVKGDIKQ